MAFNPSHLEIVNPVVEGSVYARQVRRGRRGKQKVLPVIVHGDAAVAGQGVNQEMLNLPRRAAMASAGPAHRGEQPDRLHHQRPPRLSFLLYCTDIFKMADAPIFHVNGDDPKRWPGHPGWPWSSASSSTKDVVVDIVCFRKLGHNEQDEPMVTQPLMYKKIASASGTRKLYGDKLIAEGVLPTDGPRSDDRPIPRSPGQGRTAYNPVLAGYKHPNTIDWTPFLTKGYTETLRHPGSRSRT